MSELQGLVRAKRRMIAAQDDGYPTSLVVRGNLIRAPSRKGFDGDRHQIGVQVQRDFFKPLVKKRASDVGGR